MNLLNQRVNSREEKRRAIGSVNKVARATTASLLDRCHLSDGHHEHVAKRRNAFADCEWGICEADDSHIFHETVCAGAAGMTGSVNEKTIHMGRNVRKSGLAAKQHSSTNWISAG